MEIKVTSNFENAVKKDLNEQITILQQIIPKKQYILLCSRFFADNILTFKNYQKLSYFFCKS
jgi:hypothetical protein